MDYKYCKNVDDYSKSLRKMLENFLTDDRNTQKYR